MKTTLQIKIEQKIYKLYQNLNVQPVSFQTHSQQFQSKYDGKKNKSKLFHQVKVFIEKINTDHEYYQEIQSFMNRDNNTSNTKTFLTHQQQIQKIRSNPTNLSFKKVPQTKSNNCLMPTNNKLKLTQINLNDLRKGSKKISIMIRCNQINEEDLFSSQSSLFDDDEDSMNYIPSTMRQITLPIMKLTDQLIKSIFQSPSIFLITLSLSLFVRYCLFRGAPATEHETPWILAVSTILAFKFYFDQQLDGMFQSFQNVLNINKKDLVDLERCFLQKIQYNIIVKNYDYEYVMEKFVQLSYQMNQKENLSLAKNTSKPQRKLMEDINNNNQRKYQK